MSFKYECLLNLCYWCGQLTHHDKECSIWLKRKGSMRKSDQQFGLWPRVVTPNLAKKTVIRVAGYKEDVREDTRDVTSQARRDDGGSEAWTARQNQCDRSEPEVQQTGAVLHVGLNVVVSNEKHFGL